MLWFIFDMIAILLSVLLMASFVTRLMFWSSKGLVWHEERFWVMKRTRWVERSWCFIQREFINLKTSIKMIADNLILDYYPVFKVGWTSNIKFI